MATLTERENLLRLYDEELPDWVPLAEKSVSAGMPGFLGPWFMGHQSGDQFLDPFGVLYELADPRIFPMPAPDVFKVPDITHWRDYFPPEECMPDLDSVDWVASAAADTSYWDRENRVTKMMIGGNGSGSIFVFMANLLGHKNALMAMIEEEDYWHEMCDMITTWHEKLIAYIGQYHKPDAICFCDDNAYSNGTFMSPKTYREVIKPYHKRLADAVLKAGCIPEIHCCGKADGIADDFADIGVRSWDPCQIFNDLEGVQARNGRKLILCGGWDSSGPAALKGASEEVVRGAVRKAIDRSAGNGGDVFSTSMMTEAWYVGEEHIGWISDEADKYGKTFYKA
jgi:hypothetical protein